MDPGDGIMVINKYMRGTSARPLHPAYNAYTNRHEFWALCNFVLNSVFQCLLSRLLPPPHPSTRASTMWPETGRGGERYSGPWLQVQVGVNPFGWATIDTCAVSGKHRSAIIGERRPRHRWPRSWGLVPSGTGGTGLIATFMAPRGRLMRGRWRRSKLSSLPSFCPPPPFAPRGFDKCEWKSRKVNASLDEISREETENFPDRKNLTDSGKLLSTKFNPFLGDFPF